MYAVLATGGKQYRVQEGDVIYVEKLIADVQEHLSPENIIQKPFVVGSIGDHKIIPALDVYITLSREYDVVPLIYLDTAKQWRVVYLDAFDRDDFSYPIAFKAERRVFVVETFDKLEALVIDWNVE